MDDFDSGILSQARSEYSSRLVTILSPLVLEGIKSIFSEAWKLCKENDEQDKYLMTFQNFLSRIVRWNSQIIADETQRIITKSGCNYLEDLLTCVHIAQLKILTSVRVGQKQKKIDIDIPKLDNFVHKVYIYLARKIYKNVYLYQRDIQPLQYQKNMREAEIMCRESIFEVIRDSVPVEKILRAYIDETVDEEIIETTTEEIVEGDVSDVKENNDDESKEGNNVTDDNNNHNIESIVKQEPGDKIIIKKDETNNTDKAEEIAKSVIDKIKEELENPSVAKKSDDETSKAVEENVTLSVNTEAERDSTTSITSITSKNTETELTENNSDNTIIPEPTPLKKRLSFNNVDSVLDMGTDKVNRVDAPKTIERLEEISNIRNEQRKLEEEEYDDDEDEAPLKIGKDVNLLSDVLNIESLASDIKLNEPVLSDVVELK